MKKCFSFTIQIDIDKKANNLNWLLRALCKSNLIQGLWKCHTWMEKVTNLFLLFYIDYVCEMKTSFVIFFLSSNICFSCTVMFTWHNWVNIDIFRIWKVISLRWQIKDHCVLPDGIRFPPPYEKQIMTQIIIWRV